MQSQFYYAKKIHRNFMYTTLIQIFSIDPDIYSFYILLKKSEVQSNFKNCIRL